jgi:AraC-like DNA-binding protein
MEADNMSNYYKAQDGEYQKLKELMTGLPCKQHFKIHRIYNLTVPSCWRIEENRINSDLHIIYVKGGKGHYMLDGKKESLAKGKVIFVSNGYLHSANTDQDNLLQIIPVRFGLYDNTTSEPAMNAIKPFCFSFVPVSLAKYENLFETLYRYSNTEESDIKGGLCSSVLSQILYEALNSLNENLNKRGNRNVDLIKAKDYMDSNIDKQICIESIAQNVRLSPKYFIRVFTKTYGISPYKYYINKKIQHAVFLLQEADMSVSDVASMLGYPDQFAFSKQFKSITGYSPANYRRLFNV